MGLAHRPEIADGNFDAGPEKSKSASRRIQAARQVNALAAARPGCRQAYAVLDVLDFLPGIAAPTLVLHCREDAAISFEQGRLIASRIPAARLVALESRNHILLPRDPAWAVIAAEARRFVRGE